MLTFNVKFLRYRSMTCSRSSKIDGHTIIENSLEVSVSLLSTWTLYFFPFPRYLTQYFVQNSCDLEVRRLKVIQDHRRLWSQSKARGSSLTSYLSPFSRCFMQTPVTLSCKGSVSSMSKVMRPLESPLVVSYFTSIKSDIISLFHIHFRKFDVMIKCKPSCENVCKN